MSFRIHLVTALMLAGAVVGRAEDRTRTAVERALPVLEKEGVAWLTQKKCTSCHHVPFLLWTHNAARSRGIAVDETKLAEWSDWTAAYARDRQVWFRLPAGSFNPFDPVVPPEIRDKVGPVIGKPFRTESELRAELAKQLTADELARHAPALLKRAARPPELTNDGGGLDTVVQMLLGRPAHRTGKLAADVPALADLILRWQQPDGSWKAAGQLPRQNRSEAEADAVSSMWAVLALASVDHPDEATSQGIRRAVAFLDTVKPGTTNEALAASLLVDRRIGHADRAATRLKELLGRQRRDGGWAWHEGNESDAFATGQVLYALRRSGVAADDPAVRRAVDYLIGSQGADGAWTVPGRAISRGPDPARFDKVTPIYRYWGTAWAAIGLCETLPEPTAGR